MNDVAPTNDRIRRSIPAVPPPHRLVATATVAALPAHVFHQILLAIRDFDQFTVDNDPYAEHDLGRVDVAGESFIWKVDYYDDAFEFHRENGNRLITVMSADEY